MQDKTQEELRELLRLKKRILGPFLPFFEIQKALNLSEWKMVYDVLRSDEETPSLRDILTIKKEILKAQVRSIDSTKPFKEKMSDEIRLIVAEEEANKFQHKRFNEKAVVIKIERDE